MERDPNTLLSSNLQVKAMAAGVPWDTYHADFLLGVIMEWLSLHNATLTSYGVQHNDGRDDA